MGEADIDAAIFDPANGELLATRYIGDTVRWYPKTIATVAGFVGRGATRRAQSLRESATGGGAERREVDVPRGVAHDPGAIFSFDAKSGRAQVLFELFPDLRGTAFARTVPVKFNSRDGLTLHGYLTLPPGLEARALPLLGPATCTAVRGAAMCRAAIPGTRAARRISGYSGACR